MRFDFMQQSAQCSWPRDLPIDKKNTKIPIKNLKTRLSIFF